MNTSNPSETTSTEPRHSARLKPADTQVAAGSADGRASPKVDGSRRLLHTSDASSIGGRPTKYDQSYSGAIIEHCAAGGSPGSFAAIVGVSRKTLHNWAASFPEFADAMGVSKAIVCGWYESQARNIVAGNGGPGAAQMCQFMLKNYGDADFTDRREINHNGGIHHTLTQDIRDDMSARDAAQIYLQELG